MSCRIASELVGDESPGWFALVFQGSAEETLSCSPISPLGDQDIDDVPILIHGPPQVATLTANCVNTSSTCQMSPKRPCFRAPSSGIGWAKLETPVSNGFVGDADATFREQVFDVAETECEPMI